MDGSASLPSNILVIWEGVNEGNGWERFFSFKYFSDLGGRKLGRAFPQDSNKENHSDKYR